MKRFGFIVSVLALVAVLGLTSRASALSVSDAKFVAEVTPSYLLAPVCDPCPLGYWPIGEPYPPTDLWHGDKDGSPCREAYNGNRMQAWYDYVNSVKANCAPSPDCPECYNNECVAGYYHTYGILMILYAMQYHMCVDGVAHADGHSNGNLIFIQNDSQKDVIYTFTPAPSIPMKIAA